MSKPSGILIAVGTTSAKVWNQFGYAFSGNELSP